MCLSPRERTAHRCWARLSYVISRVSEVVVVATSTRATRVGDGIAVPGDMDIAHPPS
jgi:hypothetical protein